MYKHCRTVIFAPKRKFLLLCTGYNYKRLSPKCILRFTKCNTPKDVILSLTRIFPPMILQECIVHIYPKLLWKVSAYQTGLTDTDNVRNQSTCTEPTAKRVHPWQGTRKLAPVQGAPWGWQELLDTLIRPPLPQRCFMSHVRKAAFQHSTMKVTPISQLWNMEPRSYSTLPSGGKGNTEWVWSELALVSSVVWKHFPKPLPYSTRLCVIYVYRQCWSVAQRLTWSFLLLSSGFSGLLARLGTWPCCAAHLGRLSNQKKEAPGGMQLVHRPHFE